MVLKRQRTMINALYAQFLSAMLIGTAGATALLVVRILATGTQFYTFLLWNLFLAWVPAAIAMWFTSPRKQQSRFLVGALFVSWLVFLPNTFYILSDFIHLSPHGDISILFDVVLLFSFASLGFMLGLVSLGVMHLWLRKYLSAKITTVIIFAIIFMCSYAIYLGRYLRWNSWDIILSPFGLLVDLSDKLLNPLQSPRAVSTTLIFFLLISSSYLTLWYLSNYIYNKGSQIFKS